VRDATFCPADLTTFSRLDHLGLEVVGQQLHHDHAVLLCRVVEPDGWCHACGCLGVPLLRPSRHIQRPDRSHQRPTRTPPRHRPRLPQPDQLHHPQPARHRRLQTPTTPLLCD